MYLGRIHNMLGGIENWTNWRARRGHWRAKTCTSRTGTPSFRTVATLYKMIQTQWYFSCFLFWPILKDSQIFITICGLQVWIQDIPWVLVHTRVLVRHSSHELVGFWNQLLSIQVELRTIPGCHGLVCECKVQRYCRVPSRRGLQRTARAATRHRARDPLVRPQVTT